MERIAGYVVLPSPVTGTAHVRVALVDASLADAAGLVLSTCEFDVSDPQTKRLPFSLVLPDRPQQPADRWLFDAAVTRLPGSLAPGDCVLGRSIECPASAVDAPILLPLDRVT